MNSACNFLYSNRIWVFSCLWYRGDMTLSAIHNYTKNGSKWQAVVCDIGGYDFVSYSQLEQRHYTWQTVVCDIGEIWLCQLINCKYKKNFLVEGEKGIGLEYSGGVFALVFALEFVLGNCEILCKGHGLENAWIWGIRQYGGFQDFLRV